MIWRLWKQWRCQHPAEQRRQIHGDEIIWGTPDWNRAQCMACGTYL